MTRDSWNHPDVVAAKRRLSEATEASSQAIRRKIEALRAETEAIKAARAERAAEGEAA